MLRTAAKALAILILGGTLSACGDLSDEDPILMNLNSTSSEPDEFAILPTKPLTIPEDLAALPTPTPGGSNLTDPSPRADAIAALGGNPARAAQTGSIPSSDGGVVTYATRFGRDGAIRQRLAAEDLEFRRDNNGRLLERLFNVNVYFDVYEEQSLDQQAELLRFRRAGARNVSAPPEPDQ